MTVQHAPAVSAATNPMPCPTPAPETGMRCVKTIPVGWTEQDGHPGGHMWMDAETEAILTGGHYDARTLLSGRPFAAHLPQHCPDKSTCEANPQEWT